MAAWRRNGHIAQFRRKLIDGMRARGYEDDFAERVYQQILGFGEYGFPESHSASFALITYVSAWLKCHEPAALTCALINSQPMGFYAPSQLVQDVRRHGVEVLPVDVTVSAWDCTLQEAAASSSRPDPNAATMRSSRDAVGNPDRKGPLAIRLGLRMVKGMSQDAAVRLAEARARAPFADLTDLVRRAELTRRDINALAAADALAALAGNRRQTRWQALAMERPLPLLAETRIAEATPLLRPPEEGENIVADYGSTGLSLRRHPLALLRPHLSRLRCLTGEELRALPHGTPVITAGMVTTRQRPGTATGVVFLTLEDETGQINVIVWSSLVTRHRRVVTGAHLMLVEGEIQREGEVLHVIARRLQDRSPLLGALTVNSRDFH
jgi:error-prone DNA polymerase